MWSVIKRIPNNLVLLVLAFMYLWLVTEPRLIYYAFGTIVADASLFATGWSFLKDALGTPGGFTIYVSGFLSQGYYYSWLGALIIVLAGLGMSELARWHFVRAGCKGSAVLPSVPAIALVVICSAHKHPLAACLAIVAGLLLSLIHERLPLKRTLLRVTVYGVMAVLAFWLAGAGGLLVFALMTVVYGVLVHKDYWLAVLALPVSAAVTWGLAQYVFLIPPRQAFLVLTPLSPSQTAGMDLFLKSLLFVTYGSLPLLLLAARLFAWRRFSVGGRPKAAGKKKGRAKTERRFLVMLKRPAAALAPILLMAALLCFSYDRMERAFLLSNCYSREGQWGKILELGRSLPQGQANVYVSHDIIRALYHTGRLPYDMFQFPAMPQGLLLTHESQASDLTQSKLCDIFLELGQVNRAERLASELLATRGRLGVVLERLSRINLIKGQQRTARVYLNALKKDLIYRHVATSMLNGLDHDFPAAQAARIDELRSYAPAGSATAADNEEVDDILRVLLERNPRNKMAFEYLMACYLLTGRVDKIVDNSARINDLGYPAIPTLYAEAILIYHGLQGKQIDVSKFHISRETIQRYVTFVQLRNSMQSQNRSVVLNRLIHEFGHSYFFYFTFGRIGLS